MSHFKSFFCKGDISMGCLIKIKCEIFKVILDFFSLTFESSLNLLLKHVAALNLEVKLENFEPLQT